MKAKYTLGVGVTSLALMAALYVTVSGYDTGKPSYIKPDVKAYAETFGSNEIRDTVPVLDVRGQTTVDLPPVPAKLPNEESTSTVNNRNSGVRTDKVTAPAVADVRGQTLIDQSPTLAKSPDEGSASTVNNSKSSVNTDTVTVPAVINSPIAPTIENEAATLPTASAPKQKTTKSRAS
jgi:hypothetical protein